MEYVRAYPRELPVLRDLLPSIETPTLIINGARDPVVPAANARYLNASLPKSKMVLLDGNHFLWEDAADLYADLLIKWWSREFLGMARSPERAGA
jgi:pimeloyl-ACP methyl ester carboxylesterase